MDTEYLKKMKKIQKRILNYIDQKDDSEDDLPNIKKILDNSKFLENKHDFIIILYFIINVSNNHHRGPNFFHKIENILSQLKSCINNFFSNSEIFYIFESNKRVLLFLFEEKIISIDQHIYDEIKKRDSYEEYFQPEIQDFSNDLNKKETETDFALKRKAGENDDYICKLIRNDSVEEFISHMQRTNFPINGRIPNSIFETNFYINCKYYLPSLIEYAAFFGSLQIFQYLKMQGAKLEKEIWYSAVHSNNPELIHLLEENHVKFPKEMWTSKDIMYVWPIKESIRCYHNDIAKYILNAYSSDGNKRDEMEKIISVSIENYNFAFIEETIDFDISYSFYYFCTCNYYSIVDFLVEKGIDVNKKVILTFFCLNGVLYYLNFNGVFIFCIFIVQHCKMQL